jgi:hypothetical protein
MLLQVSISKVVLVPPFQGIKDDGRNEEDERDEKPGEYIQPVSRLDEEVDLVDVATARVGQLCPNPVVALRRRLVPVRIYKETLLSLPGIGSEPGIF